jgi:hypothetical protein
MNGDAFKDIEKREANLWDAAKHLLLVRLT